MPVRRSWRSGSLRLTFARLGLLLAMLGGIAAAVWAFGATGWVSVVAAVARLGVAGFALFCGWSLVTFAILGTAWVVAAPGQRARRVPLFAWARMVREATADLLPFSQLGGIVIGARTLTAAGVPAAITYGSLIADLVTEIASQLLLTLVGLAMIAPLLAGSSTLGPPIAGGVALLAVLVAGFVFAQRSGLALIGRLGDRIVPGSAASIEGIEAARARIFASRSRIGGAFVLNTLAWLATVAGSLLVLRLMGQRIGLGATFSLEVLIFTMRSVAFAVPGALGFQEAAYALAGPLFGLPAEAALALSLAKRARDLAIGVPTLLLWQAAEARALLRSRSDATKRGAPATAAPETLERR